MSMPRAHARRLRQPDLDRRHILPNAMAPIIVQATVSVSYAILAEAGLSFLGLGVQSDVADLGVDPGRFPQLHFARLVGRRLPWPLHHADRAQHQLYRRCPARCARRARGQGCRLSGRPTDERNGNRPRCGPRTPDRASAARPRTGRLRAGIWADRRLPPSRERSGSWPSIGTSFSERGLSRRGTEEQTDRVRMARPGEDLLGRAALNDPSRIHDVHPVRIARHDAQIVGNQDQRDAEVAWSDPSSAAGSGPGS